jgi:hypothetical protein
MATLEAPKTDYLSKIIPKITGFHPIIKQKYDEEVNSWGQKKFLETPYLSDQTKISSIKYFRPETGKMLEEGVNVLQKADQFTTNIGNKATSFGNKVTSFGNKATDLGNRYMALPNAASREQKELYNLHSEYYGGKKYKRTRKNKRTRKSRKNKKKYTSKSTKKY